MYQTEAMIYLHANRLYHVLSSGTSGNLREWAESGLKVTFHTRAKVVGIMRQNACLLAFCVQNLL